MSRSYLSRTFAALYILVAVSLAASACGGSGTHSVAPTTTQEPTEFSGYVRSPALNVSEVTLPTVDGTPVNMVADTGGLKLVYFGFTTCPDVCPMTLGHVKVALAAQPKADRDRVQVVVITIDPTRDTGEKFVSYVQQFVPTGLAVRTDDPYLLRSAAQAFGADFSIRMSSQGERQVSHTDDLYVIDDTGTIVLAWPFGTVATDIERDLRRLLAGHRPENS